MQSRIDEIPKTKILKLEYNDETHGHNSFGLKNK